MCRIRRILICRKRAAHTHLAWFKETTLVPGPVWLQTVMGEASYWHKKGSADGTLQNNLVKSKRISAR